MAHSRWLMDEGARSASNGSGAVTVNVSSPKSAPDFGLPDQRVRIASGQWSELGVESTPLKLDWDFLLA